MSVLIKQFKNSKGDAVAGLTPEHAVFDSNGTRLDAKLGNVDLTEFQKAQTTGVNAINSASSTALTNIETTKTAAVAAVEAKKQEILAESDASEVSYSNTTSGLTGTNVQAAIDETASNVTSLSSEVGELEGKTIDYTIVEDSVNLTQSGSGYFIQAEKSIAEGGGHYYDANYYYVKGLLLKVYFSINTNYDFIASIQLYDADKNVVAWGAYSAGETIDISSKYPTAVYARFCWYPKTGESAKITLTAKDNVFVDIYSNATKSFDWARNGYYLEDGSFVEHGSTKSTYLIPTKSIKFIVLYYNAPCFCVLYDVDKKCIGTIQTSGVWDVRTLYPSAKFIALSAWNDDVDRSYYILDTTIKDEEMVSAEIPLTTGVDNYYLAGDGSVCPFNGLGYTKGYFPINRDVTIITNFSCIGGSSICIYDKDNALVSHIENYSVGSTYSLYDYSDAAYIRFSYKMDSITDNILFTLKYPKNSDFENALINGEYAPVVDTSEKLSWNIPDEMNVPTSFTQYFYKNTMTDTIDLDSNCDVIVQATDCTYNEDNEKIWITCNGTYITFAYVRMYGNTIVTIGTKTIKFSHTTLKTNIEKKVLFIGDSYIAVQWGAIGVLGFIDESAKADGNTLTCEGNHTPYGNYKSAAYGGWSADDFMNASESPFFFDGTFNFETYCSTYGITGLDVVVIFLGMNAGSPSNVSKMLWGGTSVTKSITDVFPNIKIVISQVPPAKGHECYSKYTKASTMINRVAYNITTDNECEGKDNVTIMPINGYHRIYAYRSGTDLYYNQFENGSVEYDVALPSTRLVAYDHHPSSFGCKVIAYSLYNAIFSE